MCYEGLIDLPGFLFLFVTTVKFLNFPHCSYSFLGDNSRGLDSQLLQTNLFGHLYKKATNDTSVIQIILHTMKCYLCKCSTRQFLTMAYSSFPVFRSLEQNCRSEKDFIRHDQGLAVT